MEPISYVMRLIDLNLGLGFYAFSRRQLNLPSVYDSLVERKRSRLYFKLGIDRQRMEFLKKDSARLRKELYELP